MPTSKQRREAAHRVSVGGNTVAATVGAGFGAAKLRDAYKEDYPRTFARQVRHGAAAARRHGVAPETVRRATQVVRAGKPGFKPLLIGSTAGAVAAGAHKYGAHLDHKAGIKKSAFGVAKAAAVAEGQPKRESHSYDPKDLRRRAASRGVTRIHDRSLRARAHQAVHPPPVRTKRVDSTALHSMGYQRQTRRMDVSFNGRPDKTYTYRMKPKDAAEFAAADSKGRHYAKQVRGKYPDGRKVTLAGRARLFADPEPVSKGFGMTAALGLGTLAATTAAPVVVGRIARKKRLAAQADPASADPGPVTKSAFGIAKSEYKPGKFKPVTELTPKQRARLPGIADSARDRAERMRADPQQARHSMNDVYQHQGVGGSEKPLKQVFGEHATPSAVHRNVHYASSIPAEHHATLDRRLDPKLTARLRHPVVFHHGPMGEHAAAAAATPHVTNGHKGHVILNSRALTPAGDAKEFNPFAGGTKAKHTLNHELAHAAVRGRGRNITTEMSDRANLGEEARADAVSQKGKGVYQRMGLVGGRKEVERLGRSTVKRTVKGYRKLGDVPKSTARQYAKFQVKQDRKIARTLGRYHEVRGLVRGAVRKSAFGIEKSDARMLPVRAARNSLYPAAHSASKVTRKISAAKVKVVPKLMEHSQRIYDAGEGLVGALS